MPKSCPSCPAGSRFWMLEWIRSGRSPEGLAREFEPSSPAIRSWVRQTGLGEGRRPYGLSSASAGPSVERTIRANSRRKDAPASLVSFLRKLPSLPSEVRHGE